LWVILAKILGPVTLGNSSSHDRLNLS
jgi:hypothetical protein